MLYFSDILSNCNNLIGFLIFPLTAFIKVSNPFYDVICILND